MADHREPIRQAIRALEDQQRLLAADLAALRSILARDTQPSEQRSDQDAAKDPKPAREASSRGGAEREILEILADGRSHMPAEIGRTRNTSSNAASNVLRRLLKKGLVVTDGAGRYRLPNADDSQGSLPVDPGRDDVDAEEGGGS
jgi:hypothetical protein